MIKSFNRDEKKALVAVLKFIFSADGRYTEDELNKINAIAESKGFEDFSEIFKEIDREVKSIDDIKKLSKNVRKKTHENDILKYAFDLATTNAIMNPEENQIFKVLAKEWNIDLKLLLKR